MDIKPLATSIADGLLAPLLPFTEPSFLDSIKHGDIKKWRRLLSELPAITPSSVELGDVVTIGSSTDCDAKTLGSLHQQMKEFIPWRKGPFRLFDINIDTEWRCDLKWQRLQNEITSLQGKTVLDIGSGNGYYSLRMAGAGAELVIGLDPHIAYVAQFWAIKHFLPELAVFVLPMTLEQLPEPLPVFDTVFSMGVLYHRRSPIDHLMQIKNCMSKGGELVLETLYVEGNEGYSLTPESRYARMSNVWFVPSEDTLTLWLRRCGFENIRVIDKSITTLAEQRQTEWMPFDSLQQSLDSCDSTKTIEGLQAPRRLIMLARKP